MTTWKYTDNSHKVVSRTLQSGAQESCLVSAIAAWIAQGNTPLPADPQPAIIADISPRQIRMALTRAGLRASVEAAVAAGDQDLKDWYEFSSPFERSNPLVGAMGTALGVSSEALDGLWQLGATL